MKKQLTKKFFAFIVIVMMFSASATAQIVYTNVSPDLTFSCTAIPCSHSYSLDLNNDGVIDFTISDSYNNFTCYPSGYYQKRSVTANSTGSNKLMTGMMNLNDVIGSNLSFSTASGTLRSINFSLHYCAGASGSWTSTADHYLALRLIINSNTYYGWVRLNVSVSGASLYFTVKDYAYDRTPNHSILAGATSGATPLLSNENASDERTVSNDPPGIETVVGCNCTRADYGCFGGSPYCKLYCVHYCASHHARLADDETQLNEEASFANIFPNPVSTSATILFFNEQTQNVSMKIFDLKGRLISTLADKIFEEGENRIEWNAEDINAGIYFLQLKSEENFQTLKLIVTK